MMTTTTIGIEGNADTRERRSFWGDPPTRGMVVLGATMQDVKCIGRFPFNRSNA